MRTRGDDHQIGYDIYHIQNTTGHRKRPKKFLQQLYLWRAGRVLVVRTEHVVKLVHGIDDTLDPAYIKRILLMGHIEGQRDLLSAVIFVTSLKDPAVILVLITLLDKQFALTVADLQSGLGTYSCRCPVPPTHVGRV